MVSMDAIRIERARAALSQAGLAALVCRLPENVLLLSGYWPMNGFALLVFPADGEPVLLAPEAEAQLAAESWVSDVRTYSWGLVDSGDPFVTLGRLMHQVAEDLDLRGKPIGYEGSFEFVAAPYVCAEPGVVAGVTQGLLRETLGQHLVDATTLIHRLRVHKTPREIEKLRLTNEIACMGLHAFFEHAVAGCSEIQVATAVETAIAIGGTDYRGVRATRGFAWVLSGPNTAVSYRPHLRSSSRRIAKGDLVVLELATVADGWWSDLTRTRAAGQAQPQDLERWQAVVEAQQADIAAMRPGTPANRVDQVGRDLLTARGLGPYFIHHTGHGVGLRYHEPEPFLHPSVTAPLEAGMVTSVEPGVYSPDWGGMRCEDNVLVTLEGAQVLSEYPRRLCD
jgi:Xaa-Pro dipeptidase